MLVNCRVSLSFSARSYGSTRFQHLLCTSSDCCDIAKKNCWCVGWNHCFIHQIHHQTSLSIHRIVVALRFRLVVTFLTSNHPPPASRQCHHHLNTLAWPRRPCGTSNLSRTVTNVVIFIRVVVEAVGVDRRGRMKATAFINGRRRGIISCC